jgi:alkylhydroperoxidase family enzyme
MAHVALIDPRTGRSADPRTQAALTFALAVVRERGHVAGAEVDALKAAGFDDEGVAELLAHVALNLFTTYVNVALDVPADFPGVALEAAA